MSNVETGITPLPDGTAITWSHEEITAEAAALFEEQAAEQTYRIELLVRGDDGTITVSKYDVPGRWLHGFLFEFEGGRDQGETVLSVDEV